MAAVGVRAICPKCRHLHLTGVPGADNRDHPKGRTDRMGVAASKERLYIAGRGRSGHVVIGWQTA